MQRLCFKIGLHPLRIWPMSLGIPILILRWLEIRFVIGLLPILIQTITNGPFVSKKIQSKVIGDISIVEIHEEDSSCEIGYVLGKVYWGHGFMTEALKAVLDFCFTQAGFQKVRARYASLNPASGRVMEKAGMSYLKTISNGVERKGYLADLIYYQISRED